MSSVCLCVHTFVLGLSTRITEGVSWCKVWTGPWKCDGTVNWFVPLVVFSMVFEHHFKEVAFFVLRTSVPFLPLRWSDSKAFMLSDSVYLCWLCPLYCQLYLTCCNIKILILRLTQVLVWSQSGCLFSQHRICYLNTVSCGRMSYCTLTLPAATTKICTVSPETHCNGD